MTLEEFFQFGVTETLGSQTFTAEAIKAFATKYDPQPFHIDEDAARHSVFGRLCASGWHTASTWMKLNATVRFNREWTGEGQAPEFGPSPGFTKLSWPKPVYAGDTVTYTRCSIGITPRAGRPGWFTLTAENGAFNQYGERVLEFQSTVLVRIA